MSDEGQDEIVVYLRSLQTVRGGDGTVASKTRLLEAADEIERLRADLLTALIVGDSEAADRVAVDEAVEHMRKKTGLTGGRIEFTRTVGAALHIRLYDGDDGFEYLVAVAECGGKDIDHAGDIMLGNGSVTSGWSLVSSMLFVVELDEPLGVAGFSKEPGPVVCALYRREKP